MRLALRRGQVRRISLCLTGRGTVTLLNRVGLKLVEEAEYVGDYAIRRNQSRRSCAREGSSQVLRRLVGVSKNVS